MDVERPALGDGQALGGERLDAEIIGARRDGTFDLAAQQILEHAEQRVLKIDRQRQQPIEEGGDRRQVFAQAAVIVGEAQSRRVLERLERAAFDLAGVEQHIELPQGRAAVDGFQIVVGAEQPLSAGLPLAPGDGAERVEPASDGAEEALLGFDVGGNRPEQRRLRLVRPVAAPEALDRGVGLPAGLQQIMHAKAAVPGREIGVVAAPGAAGIAEHEDPLLVVHEGLCLGEIGGRLHGSRRTDARPCGRSAASGR